MDPYAPKRRRVAAILKRWSTGTVTLSRTTRAAPEPATPWLPGAPSDTAVYTLDAVVKGVTAEYVDGTTVLATDLVVIVSPKAVLNGVVVDIEPVLTDTIRIGDATKVIKKISAVPAGGPPARFNVFVAS